MSTLKVNTLQDTSGNPLSRVLQIVQTVKTDTLSVSSVGTGSFTNTDSTFNVSITPSSSTSLILLGGFVNVAVSGGDQAVKMILRRDGSNLQGVVDGSGTAAAVGDLNGSRSRATGGGTIANHGQACIPISILDKPNTTSSITYSLGLGHASSVSRTMYVNMVNADSNSSQWSRFCSVFIAQEIAA